MALELTKRTKKHKIEDVNEAIKLVYELQDSKGYFKKEALQGVAKSEDGKEEVPAIVEIANKIEDFAEIIVNDGYDYVTGKKKSIMELTNDMENFLGRGEKSIVSDMAGGMGMFATQVLTRVVTKMEEPDLEIWKFVSRDLYSPENNAMFTVVDGTHGVATTRIAEGGEYNAIQTESTQTYIQGVGYKVGVMAKFSEEMKSRMGVAGIEMLTRGALNDMKRYKAQDATHLLESNAKKVFDGLDPAHQPSGVSRSNLKQKNGSLVMRDLRDFFAKTQTDGYNVDTLIINPMAYQIFINDPQVKEYFKETANVYFLLPKKTTTIFDNQLTKLIGHSTGTPKAAEGQEIIVPPIGQKTYKIIVTDLVSFHRKGETIYTPETRYSANRVVQHAAAPHNVTDILAIDSSRALIYMNDHKGVSADSINNRLTDVQILKFKERYNFLLPNDHGVFALRNLNVTDDVVDPMSISTDTLVLKEAIEKK